jgi:electron transfer flavoprotein alpha subunit
MTRIGVVIETDQGSVKETNFAILTAARAGGQQEVVALLLDGAPAAAVPTLKEYGADRIVALGAEEAENTEGQAGTSARALASWPELQAQVVAQAMEALSLDGLLGLATVQGRDLFARLAAHLDQPLISDATALDLSQTTVSKSLYSGKIVATFALPREVFLATVRPNALPAIPAPGRGELETFTAQVDGPGRVEVLEVRGADQGQVDLTEANVIITGGKPIGSADNFQMLEACAEQLGAAVGASRAAVDAGFAPHSRQVGQTGKTVSPQLYIGCGLSGSVQHFAGMKTSKVIVAVNTDVDAPIFQKCDYGIVGDMFEVVPLLTRALTDSPSEAR